jgi:hypothetical protein
MSDTPEQAAVAAPAQQPTVAETLAMAESAEQQGIAVDWKAMCMKVLQAASATIEGLNKEKADLIAKLAEEAGEGDAPETTT